MSVTGHPRAGMVRLICTGLAPHNCRVEVADGAGGWTKLSGVISARAVVDAKDHLNRIEITAYADEIHVGGEAALVTLKTLVEGAKLVVAPPRQGPRYPGDSA